VTLWSAPVPATASWWPLDSAQLHHRALSELGTTDVFRLGNGERLTQARSTALSRGDLVTATMVGYHEAIRRFHRAETDGSDQLLDAVERDARVCGLGQLIDAVALRRAAFNALEGRHDPAASVLSALELEDLDRDRRAAVWGIGHAVLALSRDDRRGATEAVGHAVASVADREFCDPSPMWGTWALLTAVDDEPDRTRAETVARAAAEDIRRRGTTINRINAGLASWAQAVAEGHSGSLPQAAATAEKAVALLRLAPWYAAVALRHVLPLALAQGWGDGLLDEAAAATRSLPAHRHLAPAHALEALAATARAHDGAVAEDEAVESPEVTSIESANRFVLTPLESEILTYVRRGMTNTEIAPELVISPRTVEKHVEKLLAKTGAGSRLHLVAGRHQDP
jgi:DNA-binding CsgD family transcriptional regulator